VDLLDIVILALRLLFVALLYAFVVVVLRSAVSGLGRSADVTAYDAASAQHLPLLVVNGGDSALPAGQVVELGEGGTLGRSPQASAVLSDATVSSEHARVRRIGGAWVISDLGSTNGTHVNGRRVDGNVPLHPGDVLTLGNIRLEVLAR
jgi:hypothetical protein